MKTVFAGDHVRLRAARRLKQPSPADSPLRASPGAAFIGHQQHLHLNSFGNSRASESDVFKLEEPAAADGVEIHAEVKDLDEATDLFKCIAIHQDHVAGLEQKI